MHNGNLDQTNFDTYLPIRMSQVPEVDIHITGSGLPPVGVGEPAVTRWRPGGFERRVRRGRHAAARICPSPPTR